MPTNRTRQRRGGALDDWCRSELLNGPCLLAGLGYHTYLPETVCDDDRMRLDWQRHRDVLLPEWIKANPGTRPYAWWKFDAPEPRPEAEAEREYLARHGLLTDGELDHE
ncbi:hypothetical protein [Thioalkalivibrio thiocyanodenitrificans]|uniref:hypothetical protein n=1 Tax=Thioalkalivibrio thiocyanodenitrificans TaxID=243063 RepID=UPI0005261256|nr:hypothetical protein [Thioalkalivibrio thiocyanodenitrificans]